MESFIEKLKTRDEYKPIKDLINLLPIIIPVIWLGIIAIYITMMMAVIPLVIGIETTARYLDPHKYKILLIFPLISFSIMPFVVGLVWRALPDNMRISLRKWSIIFIVIPVFFVPIFKGTFSIGSLVINTAVMLYIGICFSVGMLISKIYPKVL